MLLLFIALILQVDFFFFNLLKYGLLKYINNNLQHGLAYIVIVLKSIVLIIIYYLLKEIKIHVHEKGSSQGLDGNMNDSQS